MQHLGPVLRLGAAGARVDGDDRAALVVPAAEEAVLLAALEVRLEGGDAAHELLQELVVDGAAGQLLAHELLGGLEIREARLERREVLEPALGAAVLRRTTLSACSWSSQKPGARMRSSSASICSVSTLGGSEGDSSRSQPRRPEASFSPLAERIQVNECF